MVLGGDFRQCLPVQLRANRSELVDMSIKRSDLWQHFSSLQLTENMRVDLEEKEFAQYLLNVGNGDLATNVMGEIELPNSILSKGKIIEEVFGDCLESGNYEKMKDRAILAPLNKDVSKINSDIIERIPGNVKSYQSFDSVKDQV